MPLELDQFEADPPLLSPVLLTLLFPVSLSQEVLLEPDEELEELNLLIMSAVVGILAAGMYFWKAELVEGLKLALGSSPEPFLPLDLEVPEKRMNNIEPLQF